jgi:D-alanine-D-alanine ligase
MPPQLLALLVALGVLPMLLVSLRVLALSGNWQPPLLPVGDWLNQNFHLLWIAAADRDAVLHVVQLPLAALLVALTRLSLGIRVLGFRAILIAIGFQEIGMLPSLLLILVIAFCVVSVRPLMRRSGMPLYARVATILSIVAATMAGGMLLGQAVGSATLWSFAFFPVVILAMLAESIADTVARESNAMAAWRTSTTIALAVVIAVISGWPPLRQLTLACPELILTQMVLAVLVSEFIDWRLFEDFNPGLLGIDRGTSTALPVAVVRNRWNNTVLRHGGPAAPGVYRLRSVQPLVDALRHAGHHVAVLEADARLFSRLRDFIPRGARSSASPALVINCAGGVQGQGRLCHLPSLCEMIGVPYTGPDPLAMAAISDRLLMLKTLSGRGLLTPACAEEDELEHFLKQGGGPWLVYYRFQSDRRPLRASSRRALARAIARVRSESDSPLVEREPGGRRLRVVVLQGEDDAASLQVLPPLDWRQGRSAHCVAENLEPATQAVIKRTAALAFRVLRCRDHARIDLWLEEDGTVGIFAVRVVDLLSPRGTAATAARAAGIDYPTLIRRLVTHSLHRYRREITSNGRLSQLSQSA